MMDMLKLGVNVDHVATLRQARYRGREEQGEPDPVFIARLCEEAGAHGITAHLREDRRHIQDRDMFRLREAVRRLNMELAATPEIIKIATEVKPDIVCIVPERREEVTTEGGLDVAGGQHLLREVIRIFHDQGIEVSLFIDPDPTQVEAAARSGARFIELHTGAFAEAFKNPEARDKELRRLRDAAMLAHRLGLQVNAGHGLNYENVPYLLNQVPHLVELNIGHSIISRSVVVGIKEAVRQMLELMQGYDPVRPLQQGGL